MDFTTAVKTCLSKYVSFDGRAQRSEYWWFYLFTLICTAVGGALDAITTLPIFQLIVSLGLILPILMAGIRRLHDKDKSGWWLLIGVVPVIGAILLIVWFVTRGTEGENRFGPDPVAS